MATASAPVTDLLHEPARRPRLSVVVLCLGGLTAALTQTMVIPIQSELPQLLGAAATNTTWVVTVTLLTAAVTMPLAGRVADLHGKQRVLVACSLLLLAGSVCCALSDSLAPMLVGRALQGASMGFIPVGISLMREITPPHLTGGAIASMSATLGVGGAIGLPLAAWIAQTADWHGLFWVSAALAALMTVAVSTLVPNVRDAHGGRLDVIGALGLAAGLVPLLVGVSKGNEWGWTSPATLGAVGAGAVVLALWSVFEWRHPDPLVDLRTSSQRAVLMTNLAAVAVGFGIMAQAVVVPQLLQLPEAAGHGLGLSILAAGLWMAPGGLTMMAFAPVSGRLIAGVGGRITLAVGAVVLCLGYVVALLWHGAAWQLALASCVISAGVGIGYAAMPTLVLDAVPAREAAAAVGLNSLMRSMGTTLAAAAMGALLTNSTVSPAALGGASVPSSTAFGLCFAAGSLAALGAAGLALLVPRRVKGNEGGETHSVSGPDPLQVASAQRTERIR